MARAPGAPCSHGFFQLLQKRRYWPGLPGGIHRGVPTAPGSFLLKRKEKKGKRKKKKKKKGQTRKFDDICFVSCVKMLSLGFSVFVVHLVSHVLLFLYSRRSSRRVLHICGTVGDPLVCRSLSPQRTLRRGTSQRLIVQFQHRLGKAVNSS